MTVDIMLRCWCGFGIPITDPNAIDIMRAHIESHPPDRDRPTVPYPD